MNALFGSQVIANYGRIIAQEQFTPAGFDELSPGVRALVYNGIQALAS
jgi:hypothetical protein